jgi:hypothetical protein
MKYVLIAALLATLIGVPLTAKAFFCTTNCVNGICYTNCYP